jgi:transposase
MRFVYLRRILSTNLGIDSQLPAHLISLRSVSCRNTQAAIGQRLQYEGYPRREETNATILALSKNGLNIKQIVRQTGHSRKLVRQVIRGERNDVFRARQSSLDLHLQWLDEQWASGCRNGAELWRRSQARGFRGPLRVICEWATRRRRAERADAQNLQRIPSA